MASKDNQLVSLLEGWFMKLPSISPKARDIIVSIIPWYALIFGVIGVLGGISALGVMSSLPAAFVATGNASYAGYGVVYGVLALVAAALLLAAFPGTRAKKMTGWNFLFWSEVVGAVSAAIAVSVFSVIFVAIGFYLLFQIKSQYK